MKNFKHGIIITTILMLGVLCGCKDKSNGKTTEDGWIVGQDSKKLADMKSEDIIVSIERVDFTRAEYEAMLKKIESRYSATRKPDSAQLKAYMKGRSRNLITEFINRQLLICEAQSRSLEVSAEMKKSIEAAYEKQAARLGKSLDQLILDMGDTPKIYKTRVQERALIKTLIAEEFGDSLKVTDEDIKTEKADYVKYNEMCEATNKIVIARGQKMMEELTGGADFDLMALALSETQEVDPSYWGEFTRLEIDEAEISSAAFTKPVGSIAGPFDTDDGLVIIKILERNGVDSVAAETEATVKLGRIVLKMGQSFACPSDSKLRSDLLQRKRKKAMQPFLLKLNKKFRIEFPHGVNLWEVAKQPPLQMDR